MYYFAQLVEDVLEAQLIIDGVVVQSTVREEKG